MAICPQCQCSNPDGIGPCCHCSQRGAASVATDSAASPVEFVPCVSLQVTEDRTASNQSEVTGAEEYQNAPGPHALLVETNAPADCEIESPAKDGNDAALPRAGHMPPAAVTVRNRLTSSSRMNAEPVSDGSAQGSVLNADATKVSTRSATRSGVDVNSSTPLPDRPTSSPLVENLLPVTPAPSPKGLAPRLIVLRGERLKAVYPIYEGKNIIGRFADKPVDIDLEGQETIERIRVSRHHATIHFGKGDFRIEDLNSLNGTWVNGVKVHPGQFRRLAAGDVIQVGTVQLKLEIDRL